MQRVPQAAFYSGHRPGAANLREHAAWLEEKARAWEFVNETFQICEAER